MGPITRAIQTGIGLVAELQAVHEEQKPTAVGLDDESAGAKNEDFHDIHKDEGELEDDENFGGGGLSPNDDGTDPLLPDNDSPPYNEQEFKDAINNQLSRPLKSLENEKLRCPVVIPQRRPGTKGRGFLRAYAPILADFDIDQQTFLVFLKSFHKASQASPIFNVITVGAGAVGHISEPFTMAISIGISVLSGTAAEIQSRYRANAFLDQANDLLFKPRGLYCLVISLRPGDTTKTGASLQTVDTSSMAIKWLDDEKKSFGARFRASSGVTHGEEEMPETAPLVYSDTGYAELGRIKSINEQTIGKFSTYQKTVENYFDKRAQSKYMYKHPESSLAGPEKPQFASKYGDPTDPSVTMNYWGRIACKIQDESLAERQARRRAKALESRHRSGAVRRKLQSSVLYLMIVNLPSEAEIGQAKKAMEETPLRKM